MWSDPERLSSFRLDVHALGRLWRFAAPYRGWLVAYIALTALTGLVEVVPALVIQRLIDRALPHRDAVLLAQLVLALGVLYLATSSLLLAGRWTGVHIPRRRRTRSPRWRAVRPERAPPR